jgi:hypothetical protein
MLYSMDLLIFFKNPDLKSSSDPEKLTERLIEMAEQDAAVGDIILRMIKCVKTTKDEAHLLKQ